MACLAQQTGLCLQFSDRLYVSCSLCSRGGTGLQWKLAVIPCMLMPSPSYRKMLGDTQAVAKMME